MKSHIEGKIKGTVQGVCFRDTTRDFARSIGIDGFVRNEPDGTVYIEAEGEESQLEALREWLREGPSAAEVEEVDLNQAELKNYDGFNVQT